MMFLDDLGIDGETFTSIDASMYSPRSSSSLSNNPLATSPTPHKPSLLGSDNREDTADAWLPLSVATSSELPSVNQHATQVPLSEDGTGGAASAVAMEGVVATKGLSPRKRGRPRKVKQEIIKSAGGASVKQEEDLKRKAEERRERRRESNRRAARKCRDRKKSEAEQEKMERMSYLTENDRLKEENASLRQEVALLKQELAQYQVKPETQFQTPSCHMDTAFTTPLPVSTSFHTSPHPTTTSFDTTPPPPAMCSTSLTADPYNSPDQTPFFHNIAPAPSPHPHTASPSLLTPQTVPTSTPIPPLFTVAPTTCHQQADTSIHELGYEPTFDVNQPVQQQGAPFTEEAGSIPLTSPVLSNQQQGVPPFTEVAGSIPQDILTDVFSLADMPEMQNMDLQNLLSDIL